MNLSQLRHLLALTQTGSFSRAAEQLHVTQSALSRSISALEEEKSALEAGFADVRVTDGGITRRIVHHDGHEESREFSLFLAVGTKPAQA